MLFFKTIFKKRHRAAIYVKVLSLHAQAEHTWVEKDNRANTLLGAIWPHEFFFHHELEAIGKTKICPPSPNRHIRSYYTITKIPKTTTGQPKASLARIWDHARLGRLELSHSANLKFRYFSPFSSIDWRLFPFVIHFCRPQVQYFTVHIPQPCCSAESTWTSCDRWVETGKSHTAGYL